MKQKKVQPVLFLWHDGLSVFFYSDVIVFPVLLHNYQMMHIFHFHATEPVLLDPSINE